MNRRVFLQKHSALAGAVLLSPLSCFADGWRESNSLPSLASFGLEGTIPNLVGRVVYLDFWASWCAPCKASFPVLNRWHREWNGKGLTMVGVNVDERRSNMEAFLRQFTVEFAVVRDGSQKLVAAADVSTMPTAFLVDRKGIIRHVHHGFRTRDEALLGSQLSRLLVE